LREKHYVDIFSKTLTWLSLSLFVLLSPSCSFLIFFFDFPFLCCVVSLIVFLSLLRYYVIKSKRKGWPTKVSKI
jgi:hypothetical protein